MTKRSKLPPAKFREWASTLIRLETLADAACYVQDGNGERSQLLRALVRETRSLREAFVRQIAKEVEKR